MVRAGQLERVGKARATKYRVAQPAPAPTFVPPPVSIHLSESNILREDTPAYGIDPLSELKNYFREHHSLRKPVGYQRDFLDSYVPNETAWLPEHLREHLRTRGLPPDMEGMPPGTYARQVMDRLVIDLVWNSSRLEGSTFSLLETDFLLQQGRSDDPARQEEALMILNHKTAIEFLIEEQAQLGYNRYTFLNLHAILTEYLLESRKVEGALRTKPVGIGGSVFHPTNNPALIEECFDLILQKADAIRDPLECCFFLMVQMPYLQPFLDGNKRTSRLAANIPLIRGNMCPLSFTGVPLRDYTTGILAVYELNRLELLREVFVHAYEESCVRYGVIRGEMGSPDRVALGYRMELKDLAREVVVKLMTKPQAADFLRRWTTKNVTASDRDHFLELIEERLLSLHAHNLVRIKVRPSEFEAWWPAWSGQQGK
jgi:fido (protein-threonine AMPylation protein)